MKIIPSILALAILTFSACKQEPVEGHKQPEPEAIRKEQAPGEKDGEAYLLQVGDGIEMQVFMEPELNKRSEIDKMGKALFPLIGFVEAKNQSLSGLEKMLEEQYRKDYLLDPKIKVTLVERADDIPP
jgi:protein involved in polysaccharide export with SLBB domain